MEILSKKEIISECYKYGLEEIERSISSLNAIITENDEYIDLARNRLKQSEEKLKINRKSLIDSIENNENRKSIDLPQLAAKRTVIIKMLEES